MARLDQSTNKKLLLTGASGFVGSRLLSKLKPGEVRLLVRTQQKQGVYDSVVSDIAPEANYESALESIDVVIHSAARAHIMNDQADDPLSAFREVNTLGTLNLARQAAAAGVKRFIFISSIKVNGEGTPIDEPYVFDGDSQPEDDYGQSKAEAEAGLREIAQASDMELVIIRPPLVYGPGVKANFAAMMKLAQKNLPLPLGAISNKRSLVSIDNLVDLILLCIDHPSAANQTFLVSDDHDVSTTELLKTLTKAAGKKPWLLPVPGALIKGVARLLGKKAIADRLCGNLQVDISHTKEVLGWTPPVSFEQGIARCFDKAG